MKIKNFLHPDIILGLFFLGILTLPFALSDLDLTISSWFYRSGWYWGGYFIWDLLYHFGPLPGLLLSAISLIVLAGAWIWPNLTPYRRSAAVVILTLLLGPGLLINVLGKGYYGRQRPRDVVEFNGSSPFQRITQPGVPGKGKSFPCGHASVGFLFTALYFVSNTRKKTWLWIGLGYGTLMGIGRMVGGAHYASDVVWAGGLTFLSGAVVHHVVLVSSGKKAGLPQPTRRRTWLGWTTTIASLAAVSAFFLLATPYYKTYTDKDIGTANLTTVRLNITPGPEEITICHADQLEALRFEVEMQGFGIPSPRLTAKLQTESYGTTLNASCLVELDRFVTERTGRITFRLRKDLYLTMDVESFDTDIRIGEQTLPAKYDRLRVVSRLGGILLNMPPGSEIIGPVHISTFDGDVRVSFHDIANPGESIWRIGADKGILLIETNQTQPPIHPLKVKAWSRWGDVALKGNISPACGINLQWKENEGKSGVHVQGSWNYDLNRLFGPAGTQAPKFEIFLGTVKGLIGVELQSDLGPALKSVALPKDGEIVRAEDIIASTALANPDPHYTPTPFPTPGPPAWIEEELIALPFETQKWDQKTE